MKYATLLALALSLPMMAQEQASVNMFKLSVAALATSTTFDLATSIADAHGCGRVTCYEANSLLANSSGRLDTARTIAVKSAVDGGLIVAEMFLVKKYPFLKKPFSIVNFSGAGVYTYAGIHNLSIRR